MDDGTERASMSGGQLEALMADSIAARAECVAAREHARQAVAEARAGCRRAARAVKWCRVSAEARSAPAAGDGGASASRR